MMRSIIDEPVDGILTSSRSFLSFPPPLVRKGATKFEKGSND